MPQIVDGIGTMRYGSGVNTATGAVRPIGVSFGPDRSQISPGISWNLASEAAATTKDVATALSISGSASAGYGLISASASGSFAATTDTNTFDLFLVLSCHATYEPSFIEGPVTLLPVASNLLSQSGTQAFFASYGDQYVSGVIRGGAIHFILQVQTYNSTDTENVTAALQGGGLFGEFTGSVSSSFSSKYSQAIGQRQTKLLIDVIGGDPDLSHIDIDNPDIGAIVDVIAAFPGTVNQSNAETLGVVIDDYPGISGTPSLAQIAATLTGEITPLYTQLSSAQQALNNAQYACQHPEEFVDTLADLQGLFQGYITQMGTALTNNTAAFNGFLGSISTSQAPLSVAVPVLQFPTSPAFPAQETDMAYYLQSKATGTAGETFVLSGPVQTSSIACPVKIKDPTDPLQKWILHSFTDHITFQNGATKLLLSCSWDGQPPTQEQAAQFALSGPAFGSSHVGGKAMIVVDPSVATSLSSFTMAPGGASPWQAVRPASDSHYNLNVLGKTYVDGGPVAPWAWGGGTNNEVWWLTQVDQSGPPPINLTAAEEDEKKSIVLPEAEHLQIG
jgi:hypothetical protein